ncbi:MAG: hypothetical protein NC910_04000 [Candidatus Omnitrophica bacterium]|nr:hypothetical protein [Candidatus Omnitrophota bacterium]
MKTSRFVSFLSALSLLFLQVAPVRARSLTPLSGIPAPSSQEEEEGFVSLEQAELLLPGV